MPGQPYNNIETLGEGRYTGLTTVDNTNYKNDDKAGGWPFTAKRLWTSTLSKANRDSDVYNSGTQLLFMFYLIQALLIKVNILKLP